MFKLNKLADYATVIMAYMVVNDQNKFSAKELAEATHISLPTVTKLLKLLTKYKLLRSVRGAQGGYELAKASNEISLADILLAIENQLAVTQCSHKTGECYLEPYCQLRSNWQVISNVIINALKSITLKDMTTPMQTKQLPITKEIFLDALKSSEY